jgi:hypothetical protein
LNILSHLGAWLSLRGVAIVKPVVRALGS